MLKDEFQVVNDQIEEVKEDIKEVRENWTQQFKERQAERDFTDDKHSTRKGR